MRITSALWSHQKRAAEWEVETLLKYGYCWLLAQPRTGKTLTQLEVARELGAQRTLVITTKPAVQGAWGVDISERTTGLDFYPLDEGPLASRADFIRNLRSYQGDRPCLVAINYEAARAMKNEIRLAAFDLVIFDESHKAKSHNSATSLNLAEACAGIKYKVAMTGTGWDDRPTDAYGQVRLLAPELRTRPAHHGSKIFGRWNDFYEKYVDYFQLQRGVKIVRGYKHKEEIAQIVAPFTLRINSEDVLDLPDVMHIENYIDMTPEMAKLYRSIERELFVEYGGEVLTINNALTVGLRLHQLTGGFLANNMGSGIYLNSSPKLEMLTGLLEELEDYPVVVFTRFQTDVSAIAKALDGTRDVLKLTGEIDQHRAWRSLTGNEVLVVNLSAGAEAIDLSRARYVIFYSNDFSNSKYEQALARCRSHKSDKNHPITYHHLLIRGSIDGTIHAALNDKRDVAQVLYEQIGKLGA